MSPLLPPSAAAAVAADAISREPACTFRGGATLRGRWCTCVRGEWGRRPWADWIFSLVMCWERTSLFWNGWSGLPGTAADPIVGRTQPRQFSARSAHADQRAAGCFQTRFRTRQWPILCLDQRIAKGRKEKSSVVVFKSLQVPEDQDPLRKNPSTVVQVSHWNQGVLDERGRNSK